jgi:NADPH2:quinone reductase
VGFAAGEIPKLPLNLALLKGAAAVGVFWGDFARREPKALAESLRQLARWYGEGRLRPHVSQTLPLERAAEALKLLASRKAKGKVVLTTAAA